MKQTFRAICIAVVASLGMAPFECSRYGGSDPIADAGYDLRYDEPIDLVLHAEIDAGVEAGLDDGDGCYIDEDPSDFASVCDGDVVR